MNCETAIELLPWLLNGTLDPHERVEVRRHLQECEACRLALSETQEAWQTFDQHLPSEAIVALAYDEAPSGLARQAVSQHLASCARCAAELEMARTSRRLEELEGHEGEAHVLPFDLGRKAAAAPASPAGRSTARVARGWQVSALAAGLAGIVGFAGWINTGQQVRSLRERLAERPAATAAAGAPLVVATADPILLDPTETKLRGSGGIGETESTLPAGEASSLQLNSSGEVEPAERAAVTSYRLEVLKAGGGKVAEAPVRLLPDGNYSVTVGNLPFGDYELKVYGRSPEGEKVYETYRFKVGG